MNKFWFKPKRFGYGVYPVTWEGWLATAGLVVATVGLANIEDITRSPSGNIRFFIEVLVVTVIFILLTRNRVNGKLRWCWGSEKSND